MERTPRARVRMRSGCAQRAAYHRAQLDSYVRMEPKIVDGLELQREHGSWEGGDCGCENRAQSRVSYYVNARARSSSARPAFACPRHPQPSHQLIPSRSCGARALW